MWFFSIENILWNIEQLGQNSTLHSRTTHPGYAYAKDHWDLSSNEGSRAGTKIRAHIVDAAAASFKSIKNI